MDPRMEANRSAWDRWTEVHRRSEFYDLEGFKAGAGSLREIELAEVGDVAGRSLLHLQCHFGMDTLSWARRGAKALGVDFSEEAVRTARSLAEELSIPCRFLCCDVYELPRRLDEAFDIVFASYGVIWWLPDLAAWSRVAARYVKPGGFFYMAEFHPVLTAFGDGGEAFRHPYFFDPEPEEETVEGTYADREAGIRTRTYGWPHHLGEVVGALADAGLQIRHLHEFPFSPWGCFPFLEESSPGRWTVKGMGGRVPAVFAVKAGKP